MKLNEYLSLGRLASMVAEGYVTANDHKEFPLRILTYSRKTVLEDNWNDITRKCRGLIYNKDTEEIVARPFEKFFNLNTHSQPETCFDKLPLEQPTILEKIDGSIGIKYTYAGQDYIASKSSFHSDHANWATKFYQRNCINPTWPEGYTPVFEMVCQGVQHHVVHYEDDGLYLIGLINNETGEELGYNELYHWAQINGVLVPKIYNLNLMQAAENADNPNLKNEEGYVATWFREGQTPLRVKIKFCDFLRLQKILNHTSPKTILEGLENGADFDELVANTTPEFKEFVMYWKEELEYEYYEILRTVGRIYNEALFELGKSPRKEYALYFLRPENKHYSSVLFSFLDEDYAAAQRGMWKMCRELVKDTEFNTYGAGEDDDE